LKTELAALKAENEKLRQTRDETRDEAYRQGYRDGRGDAENE
jgi:hypothetical protein